MHSIIAPNRFDFLGFNIREYKSNGKLLTKPSKDAMKQFCDKVRTKIKSNKSAKASSLIRMLNHMIPGWTNYYRYGASSKAFSRVDYEVYKTLWQWAKRRHMPIRYFTEEMEEVV